MRQRAAFQHTGALRAAPLHELEAEPALADARLGHQADDAAIAVAGALEAALEQGELDVATEEVGTAVLA